MLKTLTTAYIIVFCDFITWLNMSARRTQTFVSFKKYMPPPLPYLKVNIYPFPLPHFASICFAYLWSFRWPNYIVTLPRYFSFRLPYLNIPTGPPQTNWTRIVSERGLVKISVIGTDTVTSCLRWIFICIRNSLDRSCVAMPHDHLLSNVK
jgi:hypothetical protein